MTAVRLPRHAVDRALDRLTEDLAPGQLKRLSALARLIDENDRIPLRAALAAATTSGDERTRQTAFRKFRSLVNAATGEAVVDLRLVADASKSPAAERFCWFEGSDPVGDELAERSQQAARITQDQPVPASVAELREGPVVLVRAPKSLSARQRKLVEGFLEVYRERVAALGDRSHTVTTSFDLPVGVQTEESTRELADEADVVIDLIGPASYTGPADETPTRRRPVLVALEGLPVGAQDRVGLSLAQVYGLSRPFSQCAKHAEKLTFTDEILAAVANRLTEPAARGHVSVSAWVAYELERRPSEGQTVDPRVSVASLVIGSAYGSTPVRSVGRSLPAVERLVRWATDHSERGTQLCALLGDVGMGKTTTSKLLTAALLERRAHDPKSPLPILFDLRGLPIRVLRGAAGLPDVVDALLTAGALTHRRPSADAVLDLVADGNCVLIFDGLDEVLVHLDPHEGQMFTRMLWLSTERNRARRQKDGSVPPSKLMLTCRTHYFRSVQHETSHFTGQHRDGPKADDYLALLMLPFDDEQIREYLRVNVPGAEVEQLISVIDSVHNLREIAERPLTLRMITQQLETIERAKLTGATVRAVDLYGNFVDEWLQRDNGKHQLLPEHKQLLMEGLAADLWRGGRSSWTASDVEQWMLRFMVQRPDLEIHYQPRAPDLWKEDLRTATFLVRRDDDTFTFAHTSLREYFLACYLRRSLIKSAEEAEVAWRMAVPSRETLAFLGQHLGGLPLVDRQTCLSVLEDLLSGRVEQPDGRTAGVLAFAYALTAVAGDYPRPSLDDTDLSGANLSRWEINGAAEELLPLGNASFAGADLSEAVIRLADLHGVNLRGTQLTRAEIHESDLGDADLDGASLVGTLFRACQLDGLHCLGATLHRSRALHCSGADDLNGWTVVADFRVRPSDIELTSFLGHRGPIWKAAYSPDDSRVATTGADGKANVWDVRSGELLFNLPGHAGGTTDAKYSPDGRYLVTAGESSGRVHLWAAGSGLHLDTLLGHRSRVTSVAFSPDSTRLLTTSLDGTAQIWDLRSRHGTVTVSAGEGSLRHGGFNQNGSLVVTASSRGSVHVWSAETGRSAFVLPNDQDDLNSVLFSPNGKSVLVTGTRGATLWDVRRRRPQILTSAQGVLCGAFRGNSSEAILLEANGRITGWSASREIKVPRPTWVAVNSQGNQMLVTDQSGKITIFESSRAEGYTNERGQRKSRPDSRIRTIGDDVVRFTGCSFSVNGRILSVADDGTTVVWDAATGRTVMNLSRPGEAETNGELSADGETVLTAEAGGVKAWDVRSGRVIEEFPVRSDDTSPILFSRGPEHIAALGKKEIVLWSARDGASRHVTPDAKWIAASPDGKMILGLTEGSLTVREVASRGSSLIRRGMIDPRLHVRPRARFSSDGKYFVLYGTDTAGTGSMSQPGVQMNSYRHLDTILSARFSPDGRRLLTTSADCTARVWDTATGNLLLDLREHRAGVVDGDFSADGRAIVTASEDGTLRLWDSQTGSATDWWAEMLPNGQAVSWSVPGQALIGATSGAWRWLGAPVVQDGVADRLPAETWGKLPPLELPRNQEHTLRS